MPSKEHHYAVHIEWTGNTGTGTDNYRSYKRQHVISVAGKTDIDASSDPAFRGDKTRWNPEELLVASLSSCHQLWYLHLCADAGVVVTSYSDSADGIMEEDANGAGRFRLVVLRPRVIVAAGSDVKRALALHAEARAFCFVANSVNFPVGHEAEVRVG